MSSAVFMVVVLRAGNGEIDQPRRLDLDAGGGEPRQSRGARRLDGDTAARERIDHHGGATRRSRNHADVLAPRARCRERHAGEQRQALDQAVERIDPGDAAFGEKHVGDVVLARQRTGMRDRQLARRRRAAELVGQHRLAPRRPPPAQSAARQRRAAWSRGTACSCRCRDRRASPRRCPRARDRPRCRPRPGRRSRCRAPCRG